MFGSLGSEALLASVSGKEEMRGYQELGDAQAVDGASDYSRDDTVVGSGAPGLEWAH